MKNHATTSSRIPILVTVAVGAVLFLCANKEELLKMRDYTYASHLSFSRPLRGNTIHGRLLHVNDPKSVVIKTADPRVMPICPSADLLPLELEPSEDFEALPGSWVLSEVILPYREKSSWNSYYSLVCDFIQSNMNHGGNTPQDALLRIVEVGTAYGGNTNALAARFTKAIIVAVDPLLAGYDENDLHSKNMIKWASSHGNSIEEFGMGWANGLIYDQRSKYGCRYHLVKAFSTEAGKAFRDANIPKFDVAFIDGLHTYEGVKDDIQFYTQIVVPGGILIFNDYGAKPFPGVKKAVDELVSSLGGKLVVGGHDVPPGPTNAAIILPVSET